MWTRGLSFFSVSLLSLLLDLWYLYRRPSFLIYFLGDLPRAGGIDEMPDLKRWSRDEISRMRREMDSLFDELCADRSEERRVG